MAVFLEKAMGFITGNKCPNCGRYWEYGAKACVCGYHAKILLCPVCFNKAFGDDPKKREKYLAKSSAQNCKIERSDCLCVAPYVETEFAVKENTEMFLYYGEWFKRQNVYSPYEMSEHYVNRYIFENYFPDKSRLDRNNPEFQRRYTCMYPESEESKAYFAARGTTYEEVYVNQRPKPAAPVVASAPEKCVPKCPICGSTNLVKLTATNKAIKVAAFGVFAVGDMSKAWKCRNCGSKF